MRRDILIGLVGGGVFLLGFLIFLLRNEEVPYRTCSSFSNQTEAQEYFKKYNATYLDRDGDKIACEALLPVIPYNTGEKGV